MHSAVSELPSHTGLEQVTVRFGVAFLMLPTLVLDLWVYVFIKLSSSNLFPVLFARPLPL